MPETSPSPAQHTMQCMEVWGGNQAADNGVAMPGLDAWVFSRPYMNSSGGGDVHYVSSCGTGRIARMMVADVSGHGSKVADVAVALRQLMRRFVNYIDQTRFVEAVNREFTQIARAGGFATCIATTFFAPTAVLSVSNAGHPRPLWYRSRERKWQLLIGDSAKQAAVEAVQELSNLPLGIDEPTRYDQFSVPLDRGDLVLIYTDSLIEAMSPQGRQLGEQGLLELARQLSTDDPQAMIPEMLSRVEQHRGGAEPDDDITILLLRHNGQRTQQPLLTRLAAQFRFLGMVVKRIFGSREPIPWPEWRKENILGAIIPAAGRSWRGE